MTRYDPLRHHRRSIRLKGYDYAQPGAYFVTICTQGRECLFGEIVGDAMRLNDFGRMVAACWNALPRHFLQVTLDAFIIMPNHAHGLITLRAGRKGEAFAAQPPVQPERRLAQRKGEAFATQPPVQPERPPAKRKGEAFAAQPPVQPERPPAKRKGEAFAAQPPVQPERRPANASPLPPIGTQPGSLSAIVQNFKSVSTRKVNALRRTPGAPVWQRNYYERVVRNERELAAIRQYIQNNPLKWALDRDNPAQWTRRSPPETVDEYLEEAGV